MAQEAQEMAEECKKSDIDFIYLVGVLNKNN